MPRQGEVYTVNSWSHPPNIIPKHDSFVDIKPEESPGDVPPSEISVHPHVIKLFQIFPIKKDQGNGVLNHHISLLNTALPQFPNGLCCAFAICCCGSSFLAKYFHANNFIIQSSAYYYKNFSQKTPISLQLIAVTLEETINSMCSPAL